MNTGAGGGVADVDAAPLSLLSVGNPTSGNGLRLKKGTLWGASELTKGDTHSPSLAVSGRGIDGALGSPTESAQRSPRPLSTAPGGLRNNASSPTAPMDQRKGAARAQQLQGGILSHNGSPASLIGNHARPEVSNVVLTLDTPPVGHRKLQPSLVQVKQQALESASQQQDLGAANLQQATTRNAHNRSQAIGANISLPVDAESASSVLAVPQVMLIDATGKDGHNESRHSSALQLPSSVSAGGADEIAWLRARLSEAAARNEQLYGQLQRVQQESHGLRSTLLAQQASRLDAGGRNNMLLIATNSDASASTPDQVLVRGPPQMPIMHCASPSYACAFDRNG